MVFRPTKITQKKSELSDLFFWYWRYETLNRFLAPFSQKPTVANNEKKNTQRARKSLESHSLSLSLSLSPLSLSLDHNEQIVSLDIKCLFTNVPIGEVLGFDLRTVLKHPSLRNPLRLAVKNVHFECNGILYVQSDGLAVGVSLAVILANVWKKSF